MPAAKTVHTVCSHDCPDSCGVLVTIDETGRATRVQGDPNHPITRGFLCGKVAKYLDRVYSPDRLLYPLRRRSGAAKGPLPQGKEIEAFERISWDEALDIIAARLQQISNEHGPESILPYSYAGTIGVLGYGSMDRRFFNRLGASQLDRTICSTAGGDALLSVYGRKLGTDMEHFRHARYIIAWGANVHGNNIHLWPMIEEARRNGAKLVVIDPYRTRTARVADWHIAINPGTDVALALGMMHVILGEGLEDASYIAENTHGFAELRQRVSDYTPERVSSWTGIPAADIERLAREYATTTPAVIRMNYGIQRNQNGGTAARTVAMLPVIIGAWKHLGGGLQLSTSGAFSWDKVTIERPDLMFASPLKRHARIVNMAELGHALTQLDNPPVKALFVYNSNPAAIAPDQSQVLRGMARPDLFTVVHEQFFTDTADYADILLPATTFLEHKDVQGAYGHYYVQISNQAIDPVGEARSNVASLLRARPSAWRLHRALLPRQRLKTSSPEACRTSEPEKQDQWMAGVTEATLNAAGGHQRHCGSAPEKSDGEPFLPFRHMAVPHARKRQNRILLRDLLPLRDSTLCRPLSRQQESRSTHARSPSAYPARISAAESSYHLHELDLRQPARTPARWNAAHTNSRLEMHASDAGARGICEGDKVEIFNDRGALPDESRVSHGPSSAGVVVASRLNWNKLSPGGNNVNLLTSQRLTDFGGGPTFYSTLVEVRKL